MAVSDCRHYQKLSDLYYSNAEDCAARGEFSKATELLWGTIATAMKAVATIWGKSLTAHRGPDGLEQFAEELARVRHNPELLNDFLDAQSLHRNFYEGDLSLGYQRKYFALTKRLIAAFYQDLPEPPVVP